MTIAVERGLERLRLAVTSERVHMLLCAGQSEEAARVAKSAGIVQVKSIAGWATPALFVSRWRQQTKLIRVKAHCALAANSKVNVGTIQMLL